MAPRQVTVELLELRAIGEQHPRAFYYLVEHGKMEGGQLVIEETEYHAAMGLMRGLGDLVAVVAHPVAKAVDGLLGTDLEHCQGCAERQADWNRAVPFRGH